MRRNKRPLAVLVSMMMAALLTMLAGSPAAAAPKRSDGKSNTVIFVHGFSKSGSHDCKDYWKVARTHFKNKGWKGSRVTYGLYKASKNCTAKSKNATRDTSITTLGKQLAWHIRNTYKDKKVDIVAHSMGGLVVRSAIYHVNKGTSGYPKKLYVEDVVTLSTPHAGANVALTTGCSAYKQCQQMRAGSTFLKNLGTKMPESSMGTDWTLIGSSGDAVVSTPSALTGAAQHKIAYNTYALNHDTIKRKAAGSYKARVMHSHSLVWSDYAKRGAPLERARKAVYYHKAT